MLIIPGMIPGWSWVNHGKPVQVITLYPFNYMRRLPLRDGVTVGSTEGGGWWKGWTLPQKMFSKKPSFFILMVFFATKTWVVYIIFRVEKNHQFWWVVYDCPMVHPVKTRRWGGRLESCFVWSKLSTYFPNNLYHSMSCSVYIILYVYIYIYVHIYIYTIYIYIYNICIYRYTIYIYLYIIPRYPYHLSQNLYIQIDIRRAAQRRCGG